MIIDLVSFIAIDKLIKIYIIEKARYFVLHFLFNMYIAFLVYSTSFDCFMNPLTTFDEEYNDISIQSTLYILLFHIYHLICSYKTLSFEEVIHHLVSAIGMALMTINLPFGKLPALGNLGLCGLPGGIDYLMLVFVKYNIISKKTEKYVNRFLNLLIRYPLILISTYILCINIYINNIQSEYLYIIMLVMFLQLSNSIYYCDKVVGNYYQYKIKYN